MCAENIACASPPCADPLSQQIHRDDIASHSNMRDFRHRHQQNALHAKSEVQQSVGSERNSERTHECENIVESLHLHLRPYLKHSFEAHLQRDLFRVTLFHVVCMCTVYVTYPIRLLVFGGPFDYPISVTRADLCKCKLASFRRLPDTERRLTSMQTGRSFPNIAAKSRRDISLFGKNITRSEFGNAPNASVAAALRISNAKKKKTTTASPMSVRVHA